MKYMVLIALTLALILPCAAQADETVDLLKEAIGLLQEENFSEAREVVAIALDQIDHHLLDSTAAVFPAEVEAYARGDVTTQKAMGIDMTQCTYADADGNAIEVQLMGGAGGALGGLADLGAAFGGGRKVRHHGRSGSLMEDGDDLTLSLKLKNGKNLIFETRDVDRDALTAFVDGFPVVEVDESGS